MATEFLMPAKYTGEDFGISVVIFGLDENINYEKFLIYLKDNPNNSIETTINTDKTIKTNAVAFEGLNKNMYYTVIDLIFP